MNIIWWTLYILGALSIAIIWINLMGLIGYLFKVIKNKEWAKVKVIEGPPGPKGERGDRGPEGPRGLSGSSGSFVFNDHAKATVKSVIREEGILSRKDIESLIRMEVASYLSKLEISRTTYPGLNKDEIKIGLKQGDNWMTNQSPIDVDKLIEEYREKKEEK